MVNLDVVYAILRRNVQSYFSGVLGYLVIVLFVTIAAACAFSEKFFAFNLTNLDQLSEVFPLLLLAMVPAITMNSWADERKLGTDEILFTLPATDFEVLSGKYLSVVCVYTIAILFSLTQLFVLAWIGNPDWGVVFSTYVGYWLAGVALLSAGMFASSLTGSTTVAYVLGATLCAIPVFIGNLAPGSAVVQGLSLSSQLESFANGVIPLTGVLYFVGLTAFMLYLNMVRITSRHWQSGQGALMGLHFLVRASFLALALISLNFMAERSSAFINSRVDLTSEGLFTLSQTTKTTIKTAREKERPVTIQAFVSPEVPGDFVSSRKQLIGLLGQYDRIGRNMLDVRFVDVESNSDEAKEARTLGIEAVNHRSEESGKQIESDVYMGAVITSNLGETVIPFFDGVTSMEYELTRAMATITTRPERLRLGVLATDGLRLEQPTDGRPPIRQFFERFLLEVEKQYTLIDVVPSRLAELVAEARLEQEATADEEDSNAEDDAPESNDDEETEDETEEVPDVLLVVQPSSLTQSSMNSLVEYVKLGKPVLVLADPLPIYPYVFVRGADIGVTNAPRQKRPRPDSGLSWVTNVPQIPLSQEAQMAVMQMQQRLQGAPQQLIPRLMEEFYQQRPEARPRFEPKADNGTAAALLDAIGVDWNNGRVVWDVYDPNPAFIPFWPRDLLGESWPRFYGPRDNMFLFVGSGNGARAPFNPASPISNGLQEMLFCYPGTIRQDSQSDLEFQPLVRTGTSSGVMTWDQVTYEELVWTEDVDRRTGAVTRVQKPLQSFYTGNPLLRINERPEQEFDDASHVIAAHIKSAQDDEKPSINVVFVADFDFITDQHFQQQDALGKPLDNMTFLFNAIEVLAGDESLVTLRNRRVTPRRLVAIQGELDKYRRQRNKEQQEAEEEIRDKLTDAQSAFDEKQKEITSDTELGFVQKFGQLGEARDVARQEFDIQKEELESELEQRIDELKSTERNQRERLETRIRWAAVILPPIPALLLGLIVLIVRAVNERHRVVASRRH